VKGRHWDTVHGVPTTAPKNPNAYDKPALRNSATRFEELKKTLTLTKDGRAALARQEGYHVKVIFFRGKGASYDSGTNTIAIGSENDPRSRPLTFVHEMNHAEFVATDKRVNAKTATRDEYIAAANHEESTGVSKEGEAYREFRRKVPEMREEPKRSVVVYRKAYIDVVRQGRAARLGRTAPPAR
jgi:hypothetical protein